MAPDGKDASFDRLYKVYLFRHVKYGWTSVFESSGDEPPTLEDYVRLSEGAEVSFRPLSNDEGIREALKTLDEAERKAREELNKILMSLNDQRAALRAITYQPADSQA